MDAAQLLAALERLARIERTQEEILALLRRDRRPGLDDVPELLSVKQAARVLGRSRTRVLAPAIARGEIRTVAVGKRRLVPRSEVVRVAEEGLGAGAARARRPRSRPPARGVGDRIRSLPLPRVSHGGAV